MKLVHLAVDVQEDFLDGFLDEEEAARFPKAIRKFADDLKKIGIPTIWVAYGNCGEFAYVSQRLRPMSKAERQELCERLSFPAYAVHDDENIFIKGRDDAFTSGLLGAILRSAGYDGFIISGLNSGKCVPDTLCGGKRSCLQGIVVSDLIADQLGEAFGNTEWHIKRVAGVVKENIGAKLGIIHMTRAMILKTFAPECRPPYPLPTPRPRGPLMAAIFGMDPR